MTVLRAREQLQRVLSRGALLGEDEAAQCRTAQQSIAVMTCSSPLQLTSHTFLHLARDGLDAAA